jgi:hypothetical protein
MIYPVRLCFFDRAGEELAEPRHLEGTMTLTADGTVLEFPAVVAPSEIKFIEVRTGTSDVAGAPAQDAELVPA